MTASTITSTDQEFVRRAINNAVENVAGGNRPFAAILVGADGKIIAEDTDRTALSGDPLSHGEVNVLRTGLQKVGFEAVAASTLYVNGEPCAMCAGTILRSGVRRIIFGLQGSHVGPYLAGEPKLGERYASAAIFAVAGENISVTPGVLEDEAHRPFKAYVARTAGPR